MNNLKLYIEKKKLLTKEIFSNIDINNFLKEIENIKNKENFKDIFKKINLYKCNPKNIEDVRKYFESEKEDNKSIKKNLEDILKDLIITIDKYIRSLLEIYEYKTSLLKVIKKPKIVRRFIKSPEINIAGLNIIEKYINKDTNYLKNIKNLEKSFIEEIIKIFQLEKNFNNDFMDNIEKIDFNNKEEGSNKILNINGKILKYLKNNNLENYLKFYLKFPILIESIINILFNKSDFSFLQDMNEPQKIRRRVLSYISNYFNINYKERKEKEKENKDKTKKSKNFAKSLTSILKMSSTTGGSNNIDYKNKLNSKSYDLIEKILKKYDNEFNYKKLIELVNFYNIIKTTNNIYKPDCGIPNNEYKKLGIICKKYTKGGVKRSKDKKRKYKKKKETKGKKKREIKKKKVNNKFLINPFYLINDSLFTDIKIANLKGNRYLYGYLPYLVNNFTFEEFLEKGYYNNNIDAIKDFLSLYIGYIYLQINYFFNFFKKLLSLTDKFKINKKDYDIYSKNREEKDWTDLTKEMKKILQNEDDINRFKWEKMSNKNKDKILLKYTKNYNKYLNKDYKNLNSNLQIKLEDYKNDWNDNSLFTNIKKKEILRDILDRRTMNNNSNKIMKNNNKRNKNYFKNSEIQQILDELEKQQQNIIHNTNRYPINSNKRDKKLRIIMNKIKDIKNKLINELN